MQIITIMRELVRLRVLTGIAALCAVLAGLLITFRYEPPTKFQSRQYDVGVASATALVDTPSSQVVDLGGETGKDVGSLTARATLLASLMTSAPLKDEIAKAAGVNPRLLVTPGPEASGPGASSAAAPVSDSSVKLGDRRAYVLKASVPVLQDSQIPVIAISTQAPDATAAARLANQSVAVLKRHLDTVAGSESVPIDRRLVIKQLGPAAAATERKGPGMVLGIIGMILVFGLGIATILGGSWFVRTWRETGSRGAQHAERKDESTPVDRPVNGIAPPTAAHNGVASPAAHNGVASPPRVPNGAASPPRKQNGAAAPPRKQNGAAAPPRKQNGAASPSRAPDRVSPPPRAFPAVPPPPPVPPRSTASH